MNTFIFHISNYYTNTNTIFFVNELYREIPGKGTHRCNLMTELDTEMMSRYNMIDKDGSNAIRTVVASQPEAGPSGVTLAFADLIPQGAADFLQSREFSMVLAGVFAAYIAGCAWVNGIEPPPKEN